MKITREGLIDFLESKSKPIQEWVHKSEYEYVESLGMCLVLLKCQVNFKVFSDEQYCYKYPSDDMDFETDVFWISFKGLQKFGAPSDDEIFYIKGKQELFDKV